jgi:phosphoserine aminotransferase
MISFYPGPSRVYDEVPGYVKDAHRKGLLSMNHRSEEFMNLYKKTTRYLREKLHVPKDYHIIFTSSATECWEIIAQSLVEKQSIHIFNGSFGEKWFDYSRRLKTGASAVAFDREKELIASEHIYDTGEIICLTQNETSNGTQVNGRIIGEIKATNPDHLVAVDATSSMGGIHLDFKTADVWFASVQKCFGLPAGLAIMICSPRAMDRIERLGEQDHYNSLTLLKKMEALHQTSYTPNVLGIYLLMRVLQNANPIEKIERKLIKRYESWMDFFSESKRLRPLILNKNIQSYTVIPIIGDPSHLNAVKKKTKKNGFLLGEGYGSLKGTSVRIANFPALKSSEIKELRKILAEMR